MARASSAGGRVGVRAVRGVGAVLQPAVAVGGERYCRGRGHVEPVGEVTDQAVQIGGGLLGHRHRGAQGGPRPGHDQGDGSRGEQDEQGEDRDGPARDVPARALHMAHDTTGDEHDGDGRGQQGDGQRPAAQPQHGESP